MDAHDLVSKLKDLAIDLGRTPSRDEFTKTIKGGKHHITRAFGTYAALIHASGLDPVALSKPKKIDNTIFERNIEKHIERYVPKARPEVERFPRIAVISDIHWPFHCQRVIDAFYRFIEKEKPQHIILNGDARDYYSHGKFPRSHNQFTPKEENAMGRRLNTEFWAEVRKLCPDASLMQNLGNHDARPMKRIIDAYPEAEEWLQEAICREFTFEGVKTIFDTREEIQIGSIIIHHGFKTQLGAHRDHNLQNSISSHTHRPGVVYRTVRGSVIFELNTGYAGDPCAKGLTYTATKTVDWVQSFGFVDEYGPRVIVA